MKSFKGTVHNVFSPLMVKVFSEAHVNESESQALIFVYDDEKKRKSTGLILQGNQSAGSFGNCPIICLEKETHFSAGDIILIEPNGTGTVLFEQTSDKNALFLTEQCDSRCLMCPQPPQKDSEDLAALAIHIVSLLDKDTSNLGLTGGEPTLVWEGLLKVLMECREQLPDTHLQLLTNARSLRDYEKVKALADIVGNKLLVCVTLYGDVDDLHDEMTTVPGAFWETLEGIHNLARVQIPVELRTVITKLNYQRLPQWAEFVYRSFPFAAHVALMGLEPIGLAHVNFDLLWVDPIDYQKELQTAVKILHRRGLRTSIYNHQLCVLPNRMWPFAKKAISEWKVIHLEECIDCMLSECCGGFFNSAKHHHSRGITSIREAKTEQLFG
jgi:His-Xaa-Ser system radical SAM maturase HxsC